MKQTCPTDRRRITLVATAVLALLGRATPVEAQDRGPSGRSGRAEQADAMVPADAERRATALDAGLPDTGSPADRQATTDGSSADQQTAVEASAPKWVPKLRATVKPAVAHVGDPLEVQIVVTHQQSVSVTLPLRLELGEFSELSRHESRRVLGAEGELPLVEQTYVLELAAYKLGELTLPPIEVNALGPGGQLQTIRTTPFPLRISSVMANEPKPELKQAEPPVQVFRRTYWLLYTALGLLSLLLVVIVTLLVQRRIQARRRAAQPPPPPIPAHILALERLDQLDVEALLSQGDYKQLYLQLSEIMREYIGRLWQFDALEMTTGEINRALLARQVAEPLRQRLQQHFNDWDLVKFAKFRPDETTARAALDTARLFVHETKNSARATDASPSAGVPPVRDAHAGTTEQDL